MEQLQTSLPQVPRSLTDYDRPPSKVAEITGPALEAGFMGMVRATAVCVAIGDWIQARRGSGEPDPMQLPPAGSQ